MLLGIRLHQKNSDSWRLRLRLRLRNHESELQPFSTARSQIWWFGHVKTKDQDMLDESLMRIIPKEMLCRDWHTYIWCDYISCMTWSRISEEPKELPETAENREVFDILLGVLPPRRSREENHVWKGMNKWMTYLLCKSSSPQNNISTSVRDIRQFQTQLLITRLFS